MNKLAFTICSNNYLAQAKTLGQTLLTFNPGYQFIICLVDKLSSQIDYSFFQPYEVLPIEKIPIPDFEGMVLKYDITELNTAVKPFVFKYLFARNTNASTIIYLDPDIQVYDAFTEIENGFTENTFILTPHITTAINDNFQLSEEAILSCGLYNLGFLGLSRSDDVFEFLDWWMERLKDRCYIDISKGWFVDQLWINLIPLYYKNVLILRHPGYNMAYWNLHERKLNIEDDKYNVNEIWALVFYHFSGYNVLYPSVISKYQNRYTFESRPEVVAIFEDYKNAVLQNRHEQFSAIPCFYTEIRRVANEEAAATAYAAKVKAETEAKIREIEYLKERLRSSLKLRIKHRLRKVLHLEN